MSTPTKTSSSAQPTTPYPTKYTASPTPEPNVNGAPSSSSSSSTANPTPQATLISTLESRALTLPESYFRQKVTTTNSLAESIFYGTHPTFASACHALAPNHSLDELAISLAVQLVLTTQLLETRRVNKGTALRAIAKRKDGFSEGSMQEVWDEAWEEVKGEEEERREKARGKMGKRVVVEGEVMGDKKKNGENKNGSQKRKEKKVREAAVGVDNNGAKEKGKGNTGVVADQKHGFMNGGVSCGEEIRMDGERKKE